MTAKHFSNSTLSKMITALQSRMHPESSKLCKDYKQYYSFQTPR